MQSVRKRASVRQVASGIPPSPRDILNQQHNYFLDFLRRPDPHHLGDVPLLSLYRLYELVVLRATGALKEEMAYFYHTGWTVAEIRDPISSDAERTAILACTVILLASWINHKVDSESRSVAHFNVVEGGKLRAPRREEPPSWASEAQPLPQPLVLGQPGLAREVNDVLGGVGRIFSDKNIIVNLDGLELV